MATPRFDFQLISSWIPEGSRVLDLGCGGGQLLAAARARGAIPCGVDVAAHALAARRRRGIEVATSLDALGDRRFDGVAMSHVLEHVPDVRATLARVRALLVPGGWLCLEVPNVASLRARLSSPLLSRVGADERYRAFPIHLSYFAPDTLRRACADAGLAIVAMTTNGLGIDALIPRREPDADADPDPDPVPDPDPDSDPVPDPDSDSVPDPDSDSDPVPDPVPDPDPDPIPDPVPDPARRGSSLRRLLKQLYFGSLLGENLVAVARPL